jgi:hypothetical protein
MSNFNFRGISVSTAGDVNGDGLDDLRIFLLLIYLEHQQSNHSSHRR